MCIYRLFTNVSVFYQTVLNLRHRTPVLIIIFFIKSILNAISKVLNKLQAFHFRSNVHTNTTPTVITHPYVLQNPPFCNDNGY